MVETATERLTELFEMAMRANLSHGEVTHLGLVSHGSMLAG
jgi:hypothetical protein